MRNNDTAVGLLLVSLLGGAWAGMLVGGLLGIPWVGAILGPFVVMFYFSSNVKQKRMEEHNWQDERNNVK